MKEILKKAIKTRNNGRRRYKDVDLEGFRELSSLERIQVVNEYPDLFMKKYESMSKALLIGLEDGLKKAASTDAIKAANSSGISDITGDVAVKRACISSGNVEAVYEYGKNQVIDVIIELERTLKIYTLIIDSFNSRQISYIYYERLNGYSYGEIAAELGIETDTVAVYVCTTKPLIEDKFYEVMDVINASNTIKKRIRG